MTLSFVGNRKKQRHRKNFYTYDLKDPFSPNIAHILWPKYIDTWILFFLGHLKLIWPRVSYALIWIESQILLLTLEKLTKCAVTACSVCFRKPAKIFMGFFIFIFCALFHVPYVQYTYISKNYFENMYLTNISKKMETSLACTSVVKFTIFYRAVGTPTFRRLPTALFYYFL